MFFIAQSTVKVISGRLERGERYAEWRERVGEAGRGDGERGRGGKKTQGCSNRYRLFCPWPNAKKHIIIIYTFPGMRLKSLVQVGLTLIRCLFFLVKAALRLFVLSKGSVNGLKGKE